MRGGWNGQSCPWPFRCCSTELQAPNSHSFPHTPHAHARASLARIHETRPGCPALGTANPAFVFLSLASSTVGDGACPHLILRSCTASQSGAAHPRSQTKGPPGANLFVVRKMRRGEYDAFNAEDLRREFSRYGPVTRADITMDKETGWSKGFGFVSFANVESADAAVAAIHGSWVDGCVADGVRTERALVGCSRGRLVLSCRGWGAGAE